MSKVEDLAKKYCEGSSFEDACMEKPAYIAGYHQAEKDLELSWEDIPKILHICEQLKTRWWFRNDDEQTKQIGRQPFWEEVLKQFKDFKERKEK